MTERRLWRSLPQQSIRAPSLLGCMLLALIGPNSGVTGESSVGAVTAAPPDARPAARSANVDAGRIIGADKEPQNWLSVGRDYGENRFSPLALINESNVSRLGLAWFVDLDTKLGSETTPLVVDGIMYTVGAWNVIYALDAKTGRELWRYDPKPRRDWLRYMCCGPAARGLAVWKGKVIAATIDGRLFAVDARTGAPLWDVRTTDPGKPYSITGAPRVVAGNVIIGNAGGEFGVRGYVSAYSAASGKLAWRFYTVPGDPAKGFESSAMSMAAKTWHGEYWKAGGGGAAWDSFSYDPELNLLYIGTGNGIPWSRELRSPGGGDNLFLCSIVAVRADTGKYVWHYQEVPGENWDYDCVQQMTLAQLTIDGVQRKVLMQASKNGFFYVLDRKNGKLLSANPFVAVNWASRVDPATGRPVEIQENLYTDTEAKIVAPSPFGAHNWQPMSYDPLTHLAYIPAQESGYAYSHSTAFDYQPMAWNLAQNPAARRPPPSAAIPVKGFTLAWDPVANKEVWRIAHDGPWNSGVLTTAGNLLIEGTEDGNFVVYRASSGEKLWQMPIGTGAVAGPISYTVDGEQYIAVSAGWAGSLIIIGGGLAAIHDAPARMLVFKLGGTATLPRIEPRVVPPPPPQTASADIIARGEAAYNRTCRICHGGSLISGGMIPDLRFMSAQTHQQFEAIVLGGARADQGMASFADVVSVDDAQAIHAYVIDVSAKAQGRLFGADRIRPGEGR
jgi:PQQ-dependent dehydrogenase (methanol/ethanol family)